MTRGRDPKTSRLRVLLEVALVRDRAAFASEIADHVEIGTQRVRDICRELEERGDLEIAEVSGRKIYRLTDQGLTRLAAETRARID